MVTGSGISTEIMYMSWNCYSNSKEIHCQILYTTKASPKRGGEKGREGL